jgi:hypothetical protein
MVYGRSIIRAIFSRYQLKVTAALTEEELASPLRETAAIFQRGLPAGVKQLVCCRGLTLSGAKAMPRRASRTLVTAALTAVTSKSI